MGPEEKQRHPISAMIWCGMTPTETSTALGCSRATVYRVKEFGTFKKSKGVRPKSQQTDSPRGCQRRSWQGDSQGPCQGLWHHHHHDGTSCARGFGAAVPVMASSNLDKKERVEKSKIVINEMKHKPRDAVILFSDETPLSLNEIVRSNNSTYLAEACGAADEDVKFLPKTMSYALVKCLAVVASNGKKMDLVFLKDNEKLNSTTYTSYLQQHVIPWATVNFEDKWSWQQDGASCHTSNETQQ